MGREIRRQHVVMTEDINLIMVFKVIHGWRSISHVPRERDISRNVTTKCHTSVALVILFTTRPSPLQQIPESKPPSPSPLPLLRLPSFQFCTKGNEQVLTYPVLYRQPIPFTRSFSLFEISRLKNFAPSFSANNLLHTSIIRLTPDSTREVYPV